MIKLIARFLAWLFGIKTVIPDEEMEPSTPDTTTEVVKPVVGGVTDKRKYMTTSMMALLKLIREHESGRAGYNADYRNDDKWLLTNRPFDTVRKLGRSQVLQGEASSAIGGYQFLTKTLDSLKSSLGLRGTEPFNETLQDDLAVALMIRRGYMKFMRGELSIHSFANNLAKEWASLPVVTTIKGARRTVKPGQSYYAGDGLNKAFHKPATIINALTKLKQQPWF